MTTNYHILQISVLPATNTKPARVKIHSPRFEQTKVISFSNAAGDASPSISTAVEYLTTNGFNIIGKGEGKDCYYLISDTFEPLKAL